MLSVFHGDCLEVMRALKDNSVDSIVTDPPAGIAFMSKEWDDFRRARNPADTGRDNVFGRTSAHGPEYGRSERAAFTEWLTACMSEALRVLKPGGHALVWSIPRTAHWTAWALEDAGFEIRDCISHIFGSGFPKSLAVGKAIDKAAGVEREKTGQRGGGSAGSSGGIPNMNGRDMEHGSARDTRLVDITAPATEDAAAWEGFGTALKPAHEMWWLCRKPLAAKTVASNVLQWGTGGLNIDGCRVEGIKDTPASPRRAAQGPAYSDLGNDPGTGSGWDSGVGRWPPNILLTHSADCQPAGMRVVQSSKPAVFHRAAAENEGNTSAAYGKENRPEGHVTPGYGTETVQAWDCAPDCPVAELDRQSGVTVSGKSTKVSRFFPQFNWDPEYDAPFMYCAKAPPKERPKVDGIAHPTCKPLALMRWLVRLVTPPGGLVLDLFGGTGTTAEACILEGFRYVLIEREADYIKLIRFRLKKHLEQPSLFGPEEI